MAEAVLRHVVSQLDVALVSRRRLRLEQLGFLDCLAVLRIQPSRTERIAALQAIHDTQVPFKLGALLSRILEQHNDSRAGWQNVNYCLMVRKAAIALSAVLELSCNTVRGGFCSQDPVSAQQLAASGLMPKLAESLPRLATALEAATEPHPCLHAAQGVLVAVRSILLVWPGQTGALSSKEAGPLVQPTLHLIVALFQHAVVTHDASTFDEVAYAIVQGTPYLAQQVLDQTNRITKDGQQQPQNHPYLLDILSSPMFLTVLLTLTCMILYPGLVAAAISDTCPDRPASVAADQASSSQQHDSGGCSIGRGTEFGCAGAAGVSPLDVADQQQQAGLQPQLAQVLQDLYGQSGTASTWHRLLSSCAVVTHRVGWCGNDLLQKVLPAAAECLQQVNMELQRAVKFVDEQHQTCLQLSPWGQQLSLCLHALRQLPVLLLRPLRSGSAFGVRRAAVCFVGKVVRCWTLQLKLQSSCLGVQLQQLPSAELLRLLLQQMKVLQQLRSEAAAAAATAQSTADGASSYLGSSAAVAGTESAAATKAARVREQDIAMVELLVVLTQQHSVSRYAVWQPHLDQVAAAAERCLRGTSSSMIGDVNALYAHHNLCKVCDSFLYLGREPIQLADTEGPSEVLDEFGALLRTAAEAAPDSHQQQQLFTLLISLLKSSNHFQQSGLTARELEYPLVRVSKIFNRVIDLMLDGLCHAGSDSSSNPSAAGQLLHGMPRGKILCGAAPWLVASSRLVCQMTTQLANCIEALEGQLHATAADESYSSSSSSSSGGDVGSSVTAQSVPSTDAAGQVVSNHLRRVLYCNECVMCSVLWWFYRLEDCCSTLQASSNGTDGRSSSIGTDRRLDVAHNAGTSTRAAEVQTVLAAVHDAVQDLQQAQLQEACRALQCEAGSATPSLWELCDTGLTELQQVCNAACPEWQQEVEAGKHSHWGVSASQAVLDAESFKSVLEQHELKQLLQDLSDVGQRVCAALPLKSCCNNPVCRNVSGDSERALVSRKGCVCGGCGTARYCSKDCQVAHWRWHKAICKAIKKQRWAKQQA